MNMTVVMARSEREIEQGHATRSSCATYKYDICEAQTSRLEWRSHETRQSSGYLQDDDALPIIIRENLQFDVKLCLLERL